MYISSEKEILWKQGNHTRYEYTRLGFIESVHEQTTDSDRSSLIRINTVWHSVYVLDALMYNKTTELKF